MNYLYTDTIYGKPTEDELRTAKADAAIMADAGYDPETTTKITMTPELRNHLDIHRLKMAISEIEAGNQQRLKFLEDEKEVKAERQREALNDASEAISQQDREVWLREDHYFAGYRLTGRQMEHVGKYYNDNKERIHQEWAEKGYTPEQIKDWDWFINTSANGGPKTEEDTARYNKLQVDNSLQSEFKGVIETSGIEPRQGQDVKAAVEKPANNVSAAVDFSL